MLSVLYSTMFCIEFSILQDFRRILIISFTINIQTYCYITEFLWDKMHLNKCMDRVGSDQPSHSCSLTRVFRVSINKIRPFDHLNSKRKDSDQSARMRGLIWLLAFAKAIRSFWHDSPQVVFVHSANFILSTIQHPYLGYEFECMFWNSIFRFKNPK